MPIRLKTSSKEQKYASPKVLRGPGKLKVIETIPKAAVRVERRGDVWEVRRCELNQVSGKYQEDLVCAFATEVEAERMARHILEGSK